MRDMGKYLAPCLEKRNKAQDKKIGSRKTAFAFLKCSELVLGAYKRVLICSPLQHYKAGAMIPFNR